MFESKYNFLLTTMTRRRVQRASVNRHGEITVGWVGGGWLLGWGGG